MIPLRNDSCWHFYAGNQSLLALFNLAFSLGASALFNHYKVRGRNLKKEAPSRMHGASMLLLLLLFVSRCSCLFLLSFIKSSGLSGYFIFFLSGSLGAFFECNSEYSWCVYYSLLMSYCQSDEMQPWNQSWISKMIFFFFQMFFMNIKQSYLETFQFSAIQFFNSSFRPQVVSFYCKVKTLQYCRENGEDPSNQATPPWASALETVGRNYILLTGRHRGEAVCPDCYSLRKVRCWVFSHSILS